MENELRADFNGQTQVEITRTEAEQKAILDRAIFITKVLGRRSELLAVPGENWAAGLGIEVQKMLDRGVPLDEIDPSLLEPKVLVYPQPDLVNRGDNYILGVTGHEVGHFLYSDYRKLLELQKQAKAEGKNPSDALTLANAIEDPRVNNLRAGESFRSRERLEGIYHEDMPKVLARFGELSPPMQFCFLALSSWVSEFAESGTLEKALSQATNKKAVEAFYDALPKIKQAMVERKGVRSAEIVSAEIWPIYKKLVDDYLENPTEGQTGKGQAGRPSKGGEPGQGEGRSWEELNEEEKEQLRKEARAKLDQENEEFNQEFGPKTMQAQKGEDGITHYEPKKISEEGIREFNKKLEERNQELAARKSEEDEATRKRNQELRARAAALTERRTGLTEGERQKYQEFAAEMLSHINYLRRRLNEIFPPREEYSWEKGRSRGTRITARKLPREAPTGRGLFFEKREIQEKPKAICSILVDVSGSMHWTGAIELAVKEAIMLTETLDSKEIDFELIAFSDTPEPIKKFGEKVSGKTRKQIIGLLESGGSGTALGKSVEFGARRLESQMRHERLPGFMVVHTDSEPGDDLKAVLGIYQKRMPIIGIGVGEDVTEQAIKKYFGDSGRYTKNPIEAPRELVDVLGQQFSRYRQRF